LKIATKAESNDTETSSNYYTSVLNYLTRMSLQHNGCRAAMQRMSRQHDGCRGNTTDVVHMQLLHHT
jgi:hypothetical protein